MRQAIGIRKYSACGPRQPSWAARLRSWLFGRSGRNHLVPLDHRSTHLLRDIGLGDEPRPNSLLRDHQLFRR